MPEKPNAPLFVLSPAYYGIASLIAACLAWASFLLVFAMGPDGILNTRWFEAIAVGLLPLFAFMFGLVGVGMGFRRRSWLGMITGAVGLAMTSYEAWILLVNR